MPAPVVVVGQVARDLVLTVDSIPDAGASVDVTGRWELLGGKGANIAVGLAQLGAPVAVVGVVGDDLVGEQLLAQCARDGLDTTGVVTRLDTASALMVDIVTPDGQWRYLESVPSGALLTGDDVRAAATRLRSAPAVVVQLQQPTEAALAAVRATGSGCWVVLDGAPGDDEARDALLAAATVLRCDAHEAELIAGRPIPDVETARSVSHELRDAGPSLVVLAVGDDGNLAVWDQGDILVPLAEVAAVDSTGAGDAFVAALTWSLLESPDPERAVRLATAAAGLTVSHAGGRPQLDAARVRGEVPGSGPEWGSG